MRRESKVAGLGVDGNTRPAKRADREWAATVIWICPGDRLGLQGEIYGARKGAEGQLRNLSLGALVTTGLLGPSWLASSRHLEDAVTVGADYESEVDGGFLLAAQEEARPRAVDVVQKCAEAKMDLVVTIVDEARGVVRDEVFCSRLLTSASTRFCLVDFF